MKLVLLVGFLVLSNSIYAQELITDGGEGGSTKAAPTEETVVGTKTSEGK